MMMYSSMTAIALPKRITTRTRMIGSSRQMVTPQNMRHSLAPSTRAASKRSRGIVASPARKNMVW